MPGAHRYCLWRCLTFAAVVFVSICPAAQAAESAALVKDAEQYIARGNLKAAEIELRNAIRQSPQDPVISARAARERDGDEGDYLPILADALLHQYKFADVLDLIHPGDRDAALESKVRAAIGAAAGFGIFS
jgi:hypothetical protein